MSAIKRVKVFGAGSIGNHLAHAARRLGWSVVVCDVDPAALERMRSEIYPARYGAWDDAIELSTVAAQPIGGFDLILVGTPPDVHLPLLREALSEEPAAILVEKPLCPPDLRDAQAAYDEVQRSSTRVFVGYDHVVGRATRRVEELLAAGTIGDVLTFDVEFREHWSGIFRAHPWLSGPEDSYLGFWERGGGASGEHSHATNLWQHLAHVTGNGRVRTVDARVRYTTSGAARYDDLCFLQLETETGMIGRVVQDVVTRPAQKRAHLQGSAGAIDWIAGYDARGDAVIVADAAGTQTVHAVPKVRADDFIEELQHIDRCLADGSESPLGLQRGLDTMLVMAAAHAAEARRARVCIDYRNGYALQALSVADETVRTP